MSFLLISHRQKLSKDPLDQFLQYFQRMKTFWVQMIDLELFFRYLKARSHGNRFSEKNGKLPKFIALAFKNGTRYRYHCAHEQHKWCLYIVWKFRINRSSNSRLDRAHLWTSGTTQEKNWRLSSNISGHTGPIFAIFSPYESALRADYGTVAYF